MTIAQLIARLELLERPEAKVIIYNKNDDIFYETSNVIAHKDGDVEIAYD